MRRDARRRISETPVQLITRVAKASAHAELVLGHARQAAQGEEVFHGILIALNFLPNSPTLMNAGTGLGQLSACFVLPVDDTMVGIFDAIKHMALVQRTGGGKRFSFSQLRPKGDMVASTGGEAQGRCRSGRSSTAPPRPSSKEASDGAQTWAFCASIIAPAHFYAPGATCDPEECKV